MLALYNIFTGQYGRSQKYKHTERGQKLTKNNHVDGGWRKTVAELDGLQHIFVVRVQVWWAWVAPAKTGAGNKLIWCVSDLGVQATKVRQQKVLSVLFISTIWPASSPMTTSNGLFWCVDTADLQIFSSVHYSITAAMSKLPVPTQEHLAHQKALTTTYNVGQLVRCPHAPSLMKATAVLFQAAGINTDKQHC